MSGRKRVLVVWPYALCGVKGGGQSRALSVIGHLRRNGFRVGLATVWQPEREKLAELVDDLWMLEKRLPDGAMQGNAASTSRSRFGLAWRRNPRLERLAGDVARLERPDACLVFFAWTSRVLDQMPAEVLKVLFTVDVQHRRAEIARAAGGDLSDKACSREEEIGKLSRADVLIAIQAEEKAIIQEMCPSKRVILAEHSAEAAPTPPEPSAGSDLLFVGSAYDPNVRGIRRFMEEAWPRIRREAPDARLHVCGSVCETLPPAPEGIIYEGDVEDMEAFYRSSAIVINPVPYGTGLSIKNVEALGHGKCLVTSPAGATGFGPVDGTPYVVKPVAEMAETIVELLKDPTKRHAIEQAAWRLARKRFSPDRAFRELTEVLREKPPLARRVRKAVARSVKRGAKRVVKSFGYEVMRSEEFHLLQKQFRQSVSGRSAGDVGFASYMDKHAGGRCVIIGNGPSLNETDLDLLKNEITFGLNKLFLLFPKMSFRPTYMVSCVPDVISQCREEFLRLPMPLFVVREAREMLRERTFETHYFGPAEYFLFSMDPVREICIGHTVTYVAMQLAFYMGFQKVILVGVDHSFGYSGSPDVWHTIDKPMPGRHFVDDYFAPGQTWQAPNLRMAEAYYAFAGAAFERFGREIVDCTVGGKLQVFRKAKLEDCLAEDLPNGLPERGSFPPQDRMGKS
jgi:hypothetical protein